MIRTIAIGIVILCSILFVLPPLLLRTVITGDADPMYEMAMKIVRTIARIGGIRIRVEGLDNIPAGVCLFVSNHVSHVDPVALVPSIPRRISVFLKKELFRFPILSTGMRLAKFISVDRSNREAAAKTATEAVDLLRSGLSLLIFAEGTRSPDARLRPFKNGAFRMAIQAGVPVVPVSIAGTQQLMRKGEWQLTPGEVVVRFGPAVQASEYTMSTRAQLSSAVHSLVAAGLPASQQPLTHSVGTRHEAIE
jgi:1-acyl-sn-glycerol-3-phosphate acyltransferase